MGFTRSAVAGAVKRYVRIEPRRKNVGKTPPRQISKPTPAHVYRPKMIAGDPPRAPVGGVKWVDDVVMNPVALLDLEHHHCRWPVAGGFCGCNRGAHASYCESHAGRARLVTTTA